MRLWSIHPKYLDKKGLVALWREGLLAKAVLEEKTEGYKNHPQLDRFKDYRDPLLAINNYLSHVLEEGSKRGYDFDGSKLGAKVINQRIPVTIGQLNFEFSHLKRKLKQRAADKLEELNCVHEIETHPLFYAIEGDVERWEK